MDQKKFLDLVKRDGLLGVLIALLIYFGTALQTNQSELQKELTNIKMKLVEMENKMVDTERVEAMIQKAIQNHEKYHHTQTKNSIQN